MASGGGPELAGVHGEEMVSAAATALPVIKNKQLLIEIIIHSEMYLIESKRGEKIPSKTETELKSKFLKSEKMKNGPLA